MLFGHLDSGSRRRRIVALSDRIFEVKERMDKNKEAFRCFLKIRVGTGEVTPYEGLTDKLNIFSRKLNYRLANPIGYVRTFIANRRGRRTSVWVREKLSQVDSTG